MKRDNDDGLGNVSAETILTHFGRQPDDHFGFVNTPVFRGSTVLFKTLADLDSQKQRYLYGRAGNPTTRAAEVVVTELEHAHDTHLVPSGLAAITVAILACVKSGDEILVTDNAYEPTRSFCDKFLTAMGVTTRYYDPRVGGGVASLISDNTKAIFVESPGSGTFEVTDLPAIVAVAKSRGIRVIVDNSWATPLFHKPLVLGADIVVHAATKMFIGHSDAFGGTVSANDATWPDVARVRRLLGFFTSGDEAFLMARGMRTLAIRMKEHESRALDLAAWLEARPDVTRVIHPGLPSHPDHAVFKRDFTGSGSLFSFVIPPGPRSALAAMVDGMGLFSMGYSWGGYESLLLPTDPKRIRTATEWTEPGHLLRVHVGFEGMDDLKADLDAALKRYSAAL
jgi:cystathionine beta-lyase